MTSQIEPQASGFQTSCRTTSPHLVNSLSRGLLKRALKGSVVSWMSLVVFSGALVTTRAQGGPGGSQSDIRALEPAKLVEREIAAGETHHY